MSDQNQTHHYHPIQQHVAQRFTPINSQATTSSQQQDNVVQMHSFGQGRTEVSAICQNVSANLQELENRNAHLTNMLEQLKEAGGLLSRQNKGLSVELEKVRLEISSLKSTVAANQVTISQLKQEINSTTWVNTTLKAELNAKSNESLTASNDLTVALQQNRVLESITRDLQNTLFYKSGDNFNLEKEVKRMKTYATGKTNEVEDMQHQLDDANSKVRDLNRENMRLSAKLDTIVAEERQRQDIYRNSYIAQLMRENEGEEREPEGTRKRSADDGEVVGESSNKRRNGGVLPTALVDQQADEEEVPMNSMNSPRDPQSQNYEMPEIGNGNNLVETTYQFN